MNSSVEVSPNKLKLGLRGQVRTKELRIAVNSKPTFVSPFQCNPEMGSQPCVGRNPVKGRNERELHLVVNSKQSLCSPISYVPAILAKKPKSGTTGPIQGTSLGGCTQPELEARRKAVQAKLAELTMQSGCSAHAVEALRTNPSENGKKDIDPPTSIQCVKDEEDTPAQTQCVTVGEESNPMKTHSSITGSTVSLEAKGNERSLVSDLNDFTSGSTVLHGTVLQGGVQNSAEHVSKDHLLIGAQNTDEYNSKVQLNMEQLMADVLSKIFEEITQLKEDWKKEVRTVREELRLEIAEIRASLSGSMASEPRSDSPYPQTVDEQHQMRYKVRTLSEVTPLWDDYVRSPKQSFEEIPYNGRIFMFDGDVKEMEPSLGINIRDVPPYDGKTDFIQWLEDFNSTADLAGWNEKTKLKVLAHRLQGTAKRYFESFKAGEKNNFDNAVNALKRIYDSDIQRNTFKLQLKTMRQRQYESVREFAAKFATLAKRVFSDENDAYVQKYLKSEFPNKLYDNNLYMKVLEEKKPTFDEMVEAAVYYEQILLARAAREDNDEKKHLAVYKMQDRHSLSPAKRPMCSGLGSRSSNWRTDGREPADEPDFNAPRNSHYQRRPRSEKSRKCYECGEYGHIARLCSRKNDHCTRCGEENHDSSVCKTPCCDNCGEIGHDTETRIAYIYSIHISMPHEIGHQPFSDRTRSFACSIGRFLRKRSTT